MPTSDGSLLSQAEFDTAEACVVQAIIHLRAAVAYDLATATLRHAPKLLGVLEAARAEFERSQA